MEDGKDHSAVRRGAKTLVVGLGKTGLSCVRHLSARGVALAVADSRSNPPGLETLQEEFPNTALFVGGFEPAAFEAAERLVVSPGVSVNEPAIRGAIERGVPVVGDIELFAEEAAAPVVAITGSNGKSTVTTILGEFARRAGLNAGVGANLGTPALELLDPARELYVLELSSFQLETTWTLRPRVAVVLNVSPDHMDRYANLDDYSAAKAKIYEGAEFRVFNADDPQVMAMRRGGAGEILFSLAEPDDNDYGVRQIDGAEWLCRGGEPLMPAAELLMPGRHNLANALAALALGHAVGFSFELMREALGEFPGLPHRTQFVLERRGVRWYNDSKGTNIGATIAALDGLAEGGESRVVLIAGGQGKGQEFTQLAPAVARAARAVVLFGEDAPRIESALTGAAPLVRAKEMKEAVRRAAELAREGDKVLLSPACASFDMFRGYDHRGQAFVEAVRRLPA